MGQGVSGYNVKTYEGKPYAVEQTTEHSIGLTGTPNSVLQKYNEDGELEKERYYDDEGKAYVDVDYKDQGNPKAHPKLPHKHEWDWSTDPPGRGKAQ